MSIKQTTLDLNGPFLGFSAHPQSVTVNHLGIATFIGIATATFPTQTPANPASNTGILSYQWYGNGVALSDGAFLGATLSGTATTTLTVSNAQSPTTSGTQFYLGIKYTPSAYSQPPGSAVTAGTARSTGNALNTNFNSNTATLNVNSYIVINLQPSDATCAINLSATFNVNAIGSDGTSNQLAYQWQRNGQNLTDGVSPLIQGSKTNTLTISPNSLGTSTVRVVVTDLNVVGISSVSNTATLTSVNPRSILIFEGYTPSNNYERIGGDLTNLDNLGTTGYDLNNNTFTLGRNTPTFTDDCNIITFYASEKDIDAELEIRSPRGASNGSFTGGNGGVSRIRLTLIKNQEHTILGLPNNNGIFLYRGSNLIAVVGKGGDAGISGNGGIGGGVSNAGGNGFGSNGGLGGAKLSSLSSNGIFGSLNNYNTDSTSPIRPENRLPGDTLAVIPNGGRTISCSNGFYWRNQGVSACDSVGTTRFRNEDGTLISRSAEIVRGFKPGYTITSTEGAAIISSSGNGGRGATGGSGANGPFSGGGGGSGYANESVVQVLSSTAGGNTEERSIIIFKLYVPVPPTVNISLSSNPIFVNDPTTLRWSSTNAVSVSISPDIGEPLPLPLSGSKSIDTSSSGSKTYTITAIGAGAGGTRTASTTLTINAQPPTASISANPTTINFPGTSTISWSTTNATSVNISNIGNVSTSGNTSVTPGSTTNYSITATGPGGSASSNVTIIVNQPPPPPPNGTATISISPTTVQKNCPAILRWSTSNCVSVNIVPGIGLSRPLPLSGSQSIDTSTIGFKTYTLVAVDRNNNGINASASTNIINSQVYYSSITHIASSGTVTTSLTWSNTSIVNNVSQQIIPNTNNKQRRYLVVFNSSPCGGANYPSTVFINSFSLIGAPGFSQPTMRVKSGYPKKLSSNQWEIRFERYIDDLRIYEDNFNRNWTIGFQY